MMDFSQLKKYILLGILKLKYKYIYMKKKNRKKILNIKNIKNKRKQINNTI